jgi:predicted RNase H-like nuclease (RuvC/YqgF family)
MFDGDIDRELRMQDLQIEELARQVEEYQQSNEMLKQQKPQIGNLPPMDQQ